MEQRYFIAIVPHEKLCNEIVAIKQDFADTYNSKGALRSPAHITLHMPFLWKENKEEKLIEQLSVFKFEEKNIEISLNKFSRFGERVIFIDVEKNETLTQLQKQLVRHVKQMLNLFNQDEDLRGFHPHITVAFRDLKKEQFAKAWQIYKGKDFKDAFNCESFALLKHDGKHWNVYKTFPLHA